uniref:G protein-regulated inducer of neurite outgrowth C-terminal domain-containing protein n=1 Tax=Chelydra serpentina TaxID=8475 RepID=A0A8C3SS53_CHESE
MAANSHQVQTHSHQETLNSVCHRPLNLNSHPLSKSSSSLACIGQGSSDERQSNKQDLKKSLSSTVCQTQVSENDVGSTPSSEWSSTQSGMVESSSAVKTTSDQSPGDNVQNRATTTNRFLTVGPTPISLEGKDTRMHVKSSTVENISSVCDTHQQSVNRIEGLEAAVQRSHSDLTCSCKQQSSVSHMETSATHSIISSSNRSYDTSMHNTSLQRPIYDPGTFHTAVLGPHVLGSGFANRTIIYSPTVMTIHNSTALPCISESGREQVTPGYCQSLPTSDMMTFPKLVSSVSESGLDAKQILKCCSVPGEHLSHVQHCIQQSRAQQETKTKDTWTMTSMNDLTKGLKSPLECKDAEVQTISTMECKSVATSPSVVAEGHPHVFPEVNLEHDQEAPKSPVREVRWDDEGMTWEVYGAAVDPEVLGLAIQKHIEIQIEQFQTEPIELSRKSTEESPPAKEAKKRPFRTMMHSLRHPSCCVRSNTVVE